MRRIRVLVVDDSAMFANLMVNGLSTDPALEVVGVAANPFEARDMILKYRPDVMTLDIEMPRMDGIEFLQRLMPQYPIPVVMVSSLSDKVFDALRVGAVDFISKPVNMTKEEILNYLKRELCTKVKIASTVNVSQMKRAVPKNMGAASGNIKNKEMVVALGASTGGTEALAQVLMGFRPDIPGTIVTQHMPPGFTKMFAERLNNQCSVKVKEAATGDSIVPGLVLIAPGDKHLRLVKNGDRFQVECKKGERVSGHCPSVDVMFESVAKTAGKRAVAAILTGMGKDGADGLLAIRRAGGHTIGQDENSCVVYGMPKVAYDIGAVEYQLPLSAISNKIYAVLGSL
ncbi:MAG: chemotaxis response regulator protein-glutamate methylesterase [Lachnospiraceae bacterium]|nr:chemotaxis response regulator protein-glutamate methylesterase [Lachnospiraceae bacterium]